jgi:FAD/FMN-containing dehydrogenase
MIDIQAHRATRRGFLVGAAALFSAAALPLPLAARTASPSEAAWQALAARLKGPLLRPGDPGFDPAALPFNLRYASRMPAGIAICRDAPDVAAAVRWARDVDMPLVVRGGGHSYAGYSTTEGLMISTAGLADIAFDAASGQAIIGAGARNGDLYGALAAADATITHGRCPTVGVAGFLLGGGIGFNMRLLGMASDRLVSTEIVTADGAIVAASATENPDLFWACRGGGGGNFGINTSFRVDTARATPRVVFAVRWATPTAGLLAAIIAALDAAPRELGSRLSIDRYAGEAGATINLIGQFAGTRADLDDILAPALSAAEPLEMAGTGFDYWNAQKALLDGDGPMMFQERSRFAIAALGEDFAEAALGWLKSWPGAGESAHLVMFQTGGAINDMGPAETAFVHRDSRWLACLAVTWSGDDRIEAMERALAWQSVAHAGLRRFATGGAYQNFTDPELEDWAEAYYGANLPRLRAVKRAVDPDNVFRFGQSIPLA